MKLVPSPPGSLVVVAEGMKDIQEGRDEGEELQERRSKSWSQQSPPGVTTPLSHSVLCLGKPLGQELPPASQKKQSPHIAQDVPELLSPKNPLMLAAQCDGQKQLSLLGDTGLGWSVPALEVKFASALPGRSCWCASGLTHRCRTVELVVAW